MLFPPQVWTRMKVFPAALSDFLIPGLCPEHQRVKRDKRWRAEIFLAVALVFQALFISFLFILH